MIKNIESTRNSVVNRLKLLMDIIPRLGNQSWLLKSLCIHLLRKKLVMIIGRILQPRVIMQMKQSSFFRIPKIFSFLRFKRIEMFGHIIMVSLLEKSGISRLESTSVVFTPMKVQSLGVSIQPLYPPSILTRISTILIT